VVVSAKTRRRGHFRRDDVAERDHSVASERRLDLGMPRHDHRRRPTCDRRSADTDRWLRVDLPLRAPKRTRATRAIGINTTDGCQLLVGPIVKR
jgi:hypothetical protein